MTANRVEHAYIWIKVVGGKGEGGPQVLEQIGLGGIRRHRIFDYNDSEGSKCLSVGVAPVLESGGSGDDKQPMAFYFYGMPENITHKGAIDWISTADGMNWRRGASAWILVYGVAMITPIGA